MACTHEDVKDKLGQRLSEDLAYEMYVAQEMADWEDFKTDTTVFSRFAEGDLVHMQFLLEAAIKYPNPRGIHVSGSACGWHTHNDTPECSEEGAD